MFFFPQIGSRSATLKKKTEIQKIWLFFLLMSCALETLTVITMSVVGQLFSSPSKNAKNWMFSTKKTPTKPKAYFQALTRKDGLVRPRVGR